jgi:flagellar L-ring protein precursor FlgH
MKRHIQQLIKQSLVLGLVAALSACVIQQPAQPGDPRYAPVLYPTAQVPAANDGAIYRPNYGSALFEDRKAHRVGDIITVVLSENTTSTKSTTVNMKKESAINFNEDTAGNTLLGNNPSLSIGDIPLVGGLIDKVAGTLGMSTLSLATNLDQKRDFTGEADANQSNSLQGSITVTVAEVLINGNLVVRGEKWMTLNRGDEYIRISGIVRPDDVSPDNSVVSTKMANARITYSGTGQLANNGSAGWLTRFFNNPIWPF